MRADGRVERSMSRPCLLLLLLALSCKSTPKKDDPIREGEEVSISSGELEPLASFFLETRRILAAEFIRIHMTPQFFEEKMGFTRDPRYVERKSWILEDGTRVIELRNINEKQTSNIDPDLLPRAYFGSGFEARAFRALRVYLAWPKTRERPLSVEVVGKNETGDAKLWVGGRLQHERPSITVRAELIWSEFKEEYVLRSGVD
jgi:hypothetical protein